MPAPCTCAQCRAYRALSTSIDPYHPSDSYDDDAMEVTRLDLNSAYGQNRPQLMNYSYTPEWQFNGDGPAFYGMEYEITCSDEYAVMEAAASHLGDLVIFKEDGSVRGVEMVTHPMDHPWANDNFDWEVFREIANAGGRSISDTNGIHVHVSRTAFDTPSHLYRWMKLVYRNQRDVQRIARRDSSGWAAFSDSHRKGHLGHVLKDKPRNGSTLPRGVMHDGYGWFYQVDLSRCYGTDRYLEPRERYYGNSAIRWVPAEHGWYAVTDVTSDREIMRYRSMIRMDSTRERYSAINTTNPDTLEVRVFASSVQPVRVRAALDLCSASVEYTRQLSAHDVAACNGWAWDKFIGWTGQQTDFNYSALISENERTIG